MLLRFNSWLAVKITKGMATMWCAYAFLFWSLIPLLCPQSQTVVFYVSGGIVQLVSLSLIMVGQNVIGETSERRAIETHDCVMQELVLVQEELALAREERRNMKVLLREVHTKTKEGCTLGL